MNPAVMSEPDTAFLSYVQKLRDDSCRNYDVSNLIQRLDTKQKYLTLPLWGSTSIDTIL